MPRLPAMVCQCGSACTHWVLLLLQMQYSRGDGGVAPKYDEGEDMVRQLQANQTGVDDKLQQAHIQLFKNQQLIHSGDHGITTGEGEEGQAGSDAEDSGSDESDSDAESGSDEDADASDEEDEAGPSLRGMPQEQLEVQLIHCHLYLRGGLPGG